MDTAWWAFIVERNLDCLSLGSSDTNAFNSGCKHIHLLGFSGRHVLEYVFRPNSFITGKTKPRLWSDTPSHSLCLQQTSSKSSKDKWLQITPRCSEERSAQPHSKSRLSNAKDWHVLPSDLSRSHDISKKNSGIKQTPPLPSLFGCNLEEKPLSSWALWSPLNRSCPWERYTQASEKKN